MPAYNAEKTILSTIKNLPEIYSEIILCDDKSNDNTFEVSKKLGLTSIRHEKNIGYGGNQKTLYNTALERNPKIIAMVHPDNQYDTSSVPKMIHLIENNSADLILGTRMRSALKNKMPLWKWMSNKLLTALQNKVFNTNLSEFHSGLRVYRASILLKMPYINFSDNFMFDSEVIAWFLANGYKIAEVNSNCYYNNEISSISFHQSIIYGLGTIKTLYKYKMGYYSNKY